ncbi:HAD-IA family hydrolase, partial [Bacteroidota bacterium]
KNIIAPFGYGTIRYDTSIDKLKIRNYFNMIHSGDEEEYGKPHPVVYINAAKKLRIKSINCLVFEDSLVGVIAAKAARMKVVAIHQNDDDNKPKYAVADLQLDSLTEFTEKHFELLNTFH